jgi:hypothetical protein
MIFASLSGLIQCEGHLARNLVCMATERAHRIHLSLARRAAELAG